MKPEDLTRDSIAAALDALNTAPEGLSSDEALRRLEHHGPNTLEESSTPTLRRLLWQQFKSAIVLLLVGSALLAGLVGHWVDAAAILTVVCINALFGLAQEWRAEKALAALRAMMPLRAVLLRGGKPTHTDAKCIVPGDIMLVQSGDRIAADGLLIEAHNLSIDESSLTGESHPVNKSHSENGEASLRLLFANTIVVRGRGIVLVSATGRDSRVGAMASLVHSTETRETPLQRRLDQLAKRLAIMTLIAVALVSTLGFFLVATPWIDQVLTAISLAVAGIPEGLPAVVTITLALGMRRMAQSHAIIRRLGSVETLGSTDIICTDKTGTLTLNEQTATQLRTLNGTFELPKQPMENALAHGGVLRVAVLCNDASAPDDRQADPIERALLKLIVPKSAAALRADWPRRAEIPFVAEQRFMATLHQKGLICVKGAPDTILKRCTRVRLDNKESELSTALKDELEILNRDMAKEGLRVLAFAEGFVATPEKEISDVSDLDENMVRGLTFLGLIGFIDPPRAEAFEAVQSCRRAGIRVLMMTGDQAPTAQAVGRKLGFKGNVLNGTELSEKGTALLQARNKNVEILARLSPRHKYDLVRSLQAQGHTVAMTGDGVNDAPALKAADIGIAMGRAGTDVAKGAADMILEDDNFATITRAIKEGRGIYENIVRFVRFQVTTNIAAILTVMLATAFSLGSPFAPIQLLWINVIMDGPPAVALGIQRATEDLMHRKPRPKNHPLIGSSDVVSFVLKGSIMTAGTLWVFSNTTGPLAKTLAFSTFVFFQITNLLSLPLDQETALRGFLKNSSLWVATLSVLVIQIAIVHIDTAARFMHTTALSWQHWLMAAAVSLSLPLLLFVLSLLRRSPRPTML